MLARCSVALALLLASSALAQPLTTAFTFQGRLTDGGSPVSGVYDLRFRLYDAVLGGNQLGLAQCANNVTVSEGLVAVQLDFGTVFAGQQTFLEMDVRPDSGLDCSSSAGFATLGPRQPLTSAPNASFALSASSAATLNGQPASFYTNAANLTSGLIDNARTSGATANNAGALVLRDASGDFSAGTITAAFVGNGTGLTALNAGSITTGLLPDAQLSANIARLNLSGAFTGATDTFAGLVGIGTATPAAKLHIASGSAGVAPNANSLLVVERNNSTFINVLCPASQQMGVLFGTPTNNADGGVVYNSSGARGMQFRTGGNATRVTIDSLGNVGIGTTVPLNPLSVAGATDISGSLGLGTTTPASKLEVVPASDGDGIRLTGSQSPVHSPVFSLNDGPTQRGMLGLAEAPAEFSSDALLGDLVLRSNATKLLLQTGTAASGIAIVNSNIGMGTTAPAVKLDVRGDVKLGTNGEFFALGGVENLRILRGRVNASTGGLSEGAGFTPSHPATGQWLLTFTTPFPSPPSFSVTSFSTGSPSIATIDSFSTTAVTVRTWTTTGAALNTDFFIIITGPK